MTTETSQLKGLRKMSGVDRIRPTWVQALSSARLLDEFEAAWATYEQTNGAVGPTRLNIIVSEICHRKVTGTIADDEFEGFGRLLSRLGS